MSDQEQYVIGFLTRCADEGLDTQGIQQRVKAAMGMLTPESLLTSGAIGAGVLGGLAGGVGYLGGRVAGNLTSDPLGAEEVKAKDLANTYRLLALRARQDRKLPAHPGQMNGH